MIDESSRGVRVVRGLHACGLSVGIPLLVVGAWTSGISSPSILSKAPSCCCCSGVDFSRYDAKANVELSSGNQPGVVIIVRAAAPHNVAWGFCGVVTATTSVPSDRR